MVKNIKANDPSLKSWLEISKEVISYSKSSFGIYSTKNKTKGVGVAIGDQILDLYKLYKLGYLILYPFVNIVFLMNTSIE